MNDTYFLFGFACGILIAILMFQYCIRRIRTLLAENKFLKSELREANKTVVLLREEKRKSEFMHSISKPIFQANCRSSVKLGEGRDVLDRRKYS